MDLYYEINRNVFVSFNKLTLFFIKCINVLLFFKILFKNLYRKGVAGLTITIKTNDTNYWSKNIYLFRFQKEVKDKKGKSEIAIRKKTDNVSEQKLKIHDKTNTSTRHYIGNDSLSNTIQPIKYQDMFFDPKRFQILLHMWLYCIIDWQILEWILFLYIWFFELNYKISCYIMWAYLHFV